MADVTMDVRELTRLTGVIDWVLDTETEDGDGGTTARHFFYFMLMVVLGKPTLSQG